MVDTRCGPRDAVRRTLTSPRVVIRVRRGEKTENIYMKRPVIISFVYRFNIVLYFVSARINKGKKKKNNCSLYLPAVDDFNPWKRRKLDKEKFLLQSIN
jgi:hypothetical protein